MFELRLRFVICVWKCYPPLRWSFHGRTAGERLIRLPRPVSNSITSISLMISHYAIDSNIYSNYKYICVKYRSVFPVTGLIFWAEPCVFPSADILLKRLLLWTAAAGTPKSSNVCRNFSGGKQWFGWHHVWATPRKMHFQPMHFHDAGVTQWHIKICNPF